MRRKKAALLARRRGGEVIFSAASITTFWYPLPDARGQTAFLPGNHIGLQVRIPALAQIEQVVFCLPSFSQVAACLFLKSLFPAVFF
jgi:hypothetical protein